MFENHRRGRQARNFTTNVPKILDLRSSSEQIFSENWRWVPLFKDGVKFSLSHRQQAFRIIPKFFFYPFPSSSNSIWTKIDQTMIMSSKLSNYAVLASRKGQTNLLSYDCRSVLKIILKIQETASASSVCETQFPFKNTNVIFCNNKILRKTRLRRIFSSGFSASTECE